MRKYSTRYSLHFDYHLSNLSAMKLYIVGEEQYHYLIQTLLSSNGKEIYII